MPARQLRLIPAALAALLAVALLVVSAGADPGITTRVSVDSAGNEGNGMSGAPAISDDGRFVAFESGASNLVAGDTNNFFDIFVHDGRTGVTEMVSVDHAVASTHKDAFVGAAISDDGRYVAFTSSVPNPVSADPEGRGVSVYDRQTGATTRVSVDSAGNEGNHFSFGSDLSSDGRFVAFFSVASNLVADDTNNTCAMHEDGIFDDNCSDVFVHDRQTGTTERVSVDSARNEATCPLVKSVCSEGASISGDGRFVAFTSAATNLVVGDTNSFCDANNDGVFTDNCPDIFLHDRQTGATTRVSVDSAGNEANAFSCCADISDDGRFVAFASDAPNLEAGDTNGVQDVFVHDRRTGTTTRVSVDSAGNEANDFSVGPAITGDGRFVAFFSAASNLVAGDTNGTVDVFVHDRQTGATTRVSVDSAGNQGNGASAGQAISADGRFVPFASDASNLVAGDTNNFCDTNFDGVFTDNCADVFVHDRLGSLCDGLVPTIVGTAGRDVINGTTGPDVIDGLGGNDDIDGRGGNDVICGGDGGDTLNGGTGNDRLLGQAGNDSLNGGAGDDTMDGGADRDKCDGGPHVAGDTAVNCESLTKVP